MGLDPKTSFAIPTRALRIIRCFLRAHFSPNCAGTQSVLDRTRFRLLYTNTICNVRPYEITILPGNFCFLIRFKFYFIYVKYIVFLR